MAGTCIYAVSGSPSCHQLDGLWTVTRSSSLAGGHRKADVQTMCTKFLHAAAGVLTYRTLMLGSPIRGRSTATATD